MTSTDRLDRRLPEMLEELSAPRTPDWFDDFVGLTARTRQRPAWTLPERWLPMSEIARRPVLAPRVPLRSVAIGLLVIALLVATAVAYVASRRQSQPAAPFGVAATGLVAFDRDGDIYVADPKNGSERAIVTGETNDIHPVWSLDGTRIAFERHGVLSGMLMVADADGSNAHEILPDKLHAISGYEFSPNGQQILVTTGNDLDTVYIASLDGSEPRKLDAGFPMAAPTWRPPDGREIAFTGTRGVEPNGEGATGVYAMDVATSRVRPIVAHVDGRYQGTTRWSPDGMRLAFQEWIAAPGLTVTTVVVGADGSGARTLPKPPGAEWQILAAWSNDGKHLVGIRGYTGQFEDAHGVIAPADASNPGIEMAGPSVMKGCCSSWEFAPDDSFILGYSTNEDGRPGQQLIVDPSTGALREATWETTSYPAIQRLAP